MAFFGLTDPWIIGGYVLSILSVIFCCGYAVIRGIRAEDEEDE
ncbi:hypothetical protein [Candidatus Methanoprimaticola sp. MG2]